MTEKMVAVGATSEFPEGDMRAVEIDGDEVLIVHQEGTFYALPNECTHDEYPLDDGELLDGKVKCLYHGATFDLETGKATMPAIKKIRLYQTDVQDDMLFVNYQEI
ncbi:MAG: Rieske 2Fe-2S domain-containing protein [Deinococcota bacterium]